MPPRGAAARDPEVFAPAARPVPPRAQAARQEADLLLESLTRHLRSSTLPPFSFRDQGTVASPGRHQAIGRVAPGLLRQGLTLEGLSARLAYGALQRRHRVTLHGRCVPCCWHWAAGWPAARRRV